LQNGFLANSIPCKVRRPGSTPGRGDIKWLKTKDLMGDCLWTGKVPLSTTNTKRSIPLG